jgi:hypothetical protein
MNQTGGRCWWLIALGLLATVAASCRTVTPDHTQIRIEFYPIMTPGLVIDGHEIRVDQDFDALPFFVVADGDISSWEVMTLRGRVHVLRVDSFGVLEARAAGAPGPGYVSLFRLLVKQEEYWGFVLVQPYATYLPANTIDIVASTQTLWLMMNGVGESTGPDQVDRRQVERDLDEVRASLNLSAGRWEGPGRR